MSSQGRNACNSPFWVQLTGTAGHSPSDLSGSLSVGDIDFLDTQLLVQFNGFSGSPPMCPVWNTLNVQAVLLCSFKFTKSSKLLGDPGKLQRARVFSVWFWFVCFAVYLAWLWGVQ